MDEESSGDGPEVVTESCVFCEITAGRAPASMVYEDAEVLSFMTLRPTRPGECLVVPRDHIDHFIDVPASLLTHLVEVTRRVGRAIQDEFQPLRVGMVVHGFGVPHVHFILVPQHAPDDITSARFAVVENGEVHFRHRNIPETPRDELNRHAERLRQTLDVTDSGAT